ncbi:MAG: DUF222 domain-containing protein [Actinomycetota bacterium]
MTARVSASDAARDLDAFSCAVRRLTGNVRASGALDQAALTSVLRAARNLQADLDALVTMLGVAADGLAAEGRSAPSAELLLDQGQVRADTARNEAARSKVVSWVPGLADAVSAGRIGSDHLDSLARHTRRLVDDGRTDQMLAGLGALVDEAERLPADTFDAEVRRTVRSLDSRFAEADAQEKRNASEVRTWFDPRTGMGRLSGTLDPEWYELVAKALDARTAQLAAETNGAVRRDEHLAPAALIDLVSSGDSGRPSRAQLAVVVDLHTLAAARASDESAPCTHATVGRTENGHELTASTLSRLSCDATLRRVVIDHRSIPIDVGRAERTATDAQWAALRAMHTTCGWPGCTRPLAHCQAHHVQPWAQGGRTDIDNLLPLCSTHHHRVHEGGWHMQVSPDRSLTIHRPDGERHHVPASTSERGREPPSRSRAGTADRRGPPHPRPEWSG